MDDKVSDYIPQMKGSAYDDVSIRQLLTMTSGIKWNEDYADPNSDVAKFNNHKPEEGVDALVSYMRKLPREAPAGTRWLYSTGETNLFQTVAMATFGGLMTTAVSRRVAFLAKAFLSTLNASWSLSPMPTGLAAPETL